MDLLLDPNVAYVLLVVGVFLGLLAILAPGTGMLEIGAGGSLLLAAYALTRLQFNWWALVILAVSVIPFVLSFRRSPRLRAVLLALTLLGMVAGSVFVFRDAQGRPAVNAVLAAIVSIAFTVLSWVMTNRGLEALHVRPTHDLNDLVGKIGETRTEVFAEGSVQVDGELWSARSEHSIPAGAPVRVVGREGFHLVVEPAPESA